MARDKYNPHGEDLEPWRAAIYRKRGHHRERTHWYALQSGWSVRGDYCETGDGSALERLLADRAEYDLVVFPSLTAVGSDAREILLTLDRILRAGLEFASLRERIDSLQSWEVTDLVKAAAKLDRRKRRGRPRVEVDMDRLQDMHSRGLSLRQMARLLKVSKSTVERLLKPLRREPSPTVLGFSL